MHLSAERAYPTPLSNSTLLPLLLLSLARQRHTPDVSTKIKKEYDYIIVGGGSAGSVLASRLSELPCVDVLLIEAGHEPPSLSEVPALGRYFRFTDVDWQYRTSPQKYTGKALINRQVVLSGGKMLGGSSSLNSMLYVRGNKRNYDDWAEQGAKGWSYKDVYPYFLKLENNKEREFLSNGYHTTGGPVTVHSPRYERELKRAVYKAATGLGYKEVDSNAEIQTGLYNHQATLRNNQRCSTAKAYLVPAENRTNLDILTNSMVTKIIIRRQQARGVQFDSNGHTYEVRARKEVILSAGTIKTVQLLMLSGIGPKNELQRLHIPLVSDLPVGENLQDHGGTNIPFVLNPRMPNFEAKLSDPANIHQYIRNRTGPLASTDGINYLAFLKGQAIYTPDDFPNYQLYFSEMSAAVIRDQSGLKPEVYRRLYGPYKKRPLLICTVSQLQPRSRGTVTLRSKNPYDPPVINPNYLEDPRDVEDIVQGMKTCERIGTSVALRKLGARAFKTLIPGCERYAEDEDKYFTCQVRSIFISLQHPVGTVKMGDPRDPTAVVDPHLRVKNIKGLRVVDASIMPIIPSGDINIPTIMVAEKASEMIKETIHCYRKDSEHWDEPDDSSEWSQEEKSEEDTGVWEKWDKSLEVPWEEEHADVPKHQWNIPEEVTWLEKEKKCLEDYLNDHPEHTSWPEEKVDSHEDHLSIPQQYSWSDDDKYYLSDYIKDPEKLALVKNGKENYWKKSMPYSWYKRQTNLLLKEINKPIHSSWEDKSQYSPVPWRGPYNYKMTKSIDELVKLADMIPKEKSPDYRWGKSYKKSKIPWYHSY